MVHAFHCYLNLSVPESESNKTLNDMFLPFISSPSNPHLSLLFFFLFGRTEFFPKKIEVGLEVRIPSSPSSFLAADFPGTQMLSPKTFPNGDSIRQASRLVNLHWQLSNLFPKALGQKAPCQPPPTTGQQAPTFKPYSPPFLPKSFMVSTYSA